MSSNESQTQEPATAVNRRILSLPVHQWLESAQQSHGIPHHDYSQYHSYCTRRLSRLRHAKEVRRDLVHSSAYVSGSGSGKQTRRHAYVPRDIIPPLPTTATTDSTATSEDDADDSAPTIAAAPAKELHENVLWVLLVGAERAWAHAGELRARYTEGTNSNSTTNASSNAFSSLTTSKSKRSPGQLRHHSLRRLKRAQQLAHQLEQVAMQFSESPAPQKHGDHDASPLPVVVDSRTVQECQAYASWMRANGALEMADWKTACEEYRSAITICRKLSQLAAEEADVASPNLIDEDKEGDDDAGAINIAESLELRDLFTTRADNMLPLLKYCQYEWREANGGTLPESWEDPETTLSSSSTTSAKKDLGGGSTVSFRGQEIPIENKSLRVLLLKAEGLLQQQPQEPAANSTAATTTTMDQDGKFDTLLSTFDDAMSLVMQELKSYEGAKAGPAVNAKRRELELLSGYIQYEKLATTCRRLEALLPTLTEDAEIVHVYDALLQDARAILSLPSSSGKQDSEQEEEDEFWLQANANVLRIRAFRCYYLAKLYANGQQYGPAKALLKQVKLLSTRAMEEIAACDEDMEHGEEFMSSLQHLQDYDLVAMSCRVQAQAYLSSQGASRSYYNDKSSGGGAGGGGTNRSLLVRLADFDPGQAPPGSRQLADVPPDVLPLPCKPVFYDVAWNYASQFPDLDPLLATRKPKTKPTGGGGGLFGWLRGSASDNK